MSSEARFVHHRKRQVDQAITRACALLSGNWSARESFDRLLDRTRRRSPAILAAPVVDGRHLGIQALSNLARFSRFHLRSIEAWPGSDVYWQGSIRSLAQYLVGRYPVPGFLASAWYALAEEKRRWYVAHARGSRFRSLGLPISLTRRMERVLLGTSDHVGIEQAIRRAELVGLGAGADLIEAVLSSRLGSDLTHGAFWRTVWRFFIANARSIPSHQLAPLVDFLYSIRQERVPVATARGMVLQEPPRPDFSIKGRTPRSLLRLMEEWHRGLGGGGGGVRWERSALRPMILEVPHRDPSSPPVRWEITELTSRGDLRAEGAGLRHCVASYATRCQQGRSRIWSLRRRSGQSLRSILTIEIDPSRKTIVQARGFRNQPASGRALEVLETWAVRERLRLSMG